MSASPRRILWLPARCRSGYPPVRIDGKLYVDGGVMDILPIWAAAEMGATRVIAVNVLPLMPSWPLRAAARVVRWLGPKPAATQPPPRLWMSS